MDQSENNKLLRTFLIFGEALLTAGAEIGRVEDTLSRLCAAYGAVKTDVFVITSHIILTLRFGDGSMVTGSRRILHAAAFDFTRLDRLNALARACVKSPMPREELKEELKRISKAPAKKWKLYLGSALAAGAFSLFFGGSSWDAALSAVVGLLICLMQFVFSPRCPNNAFFLFIASLLCGVLICGIAKCFAVFRADQVIIGDIMLLVPGIAITTAARDMVVGDTISGATRLLESLLWAAMLAGGFMLSVLLLGRAV